MLLNEVKELDETNVKSEDDIRVRGNEDNLNDEAIVHNKSRMESEDKVQNSIYPTFGIESTSDEGENQVNPLKTLG
jgi:hypothetical protein